MADETYSAFKEEEKKATMPDPKRRRPGLRGAGRATPRRQQLSRSQQQDYTTFKAEFEATLNTAMLSAVHTIKQEIAAQHEQTRAEVRASRKDVLAAIKESPVEYVKILAEFAATFLIFCLALRLLLRVELVNTTFAVIMLIACGVYWGMARLKERSANSEKHAK